MNQLYLWKKESVYTYPWQRQFLNVDFLKYEKKRITDVGEWYINFKKHSIGQALEEVYYYVVEVKLDSDWKATIASKGNYNYFGLSALKNCHQVLLLMLIPRDKKIPRPYSLIRIIKSKKDFIHDERTNEAQYVVNVEDFEEIDNSYLYLDVPFEKRSVQKFIKENLINDDLIANSFQPTISGSPYEINKKGGISLSTFLKNNSFSDELIRTLKLMQPPEFTDIQFSLPTILKKGKEFPLWKGIKFKVSEVNTLGRNFFTAFSSNNYDNLNKELIKRDLFEGEYSIACSLFPKGDNKSELLNDILSKFVKTEITHPFNTDELKYWDVDLTIAQRNIDEDLWLQIANQRQIKPTIIKDSTEVINLRNSLFQEWKIIFESVGLKKNIEHSAKVYSSASFNNVLKVAQSIARDYRSDQVNELMINKSYKIFIENSDILINNPEIQNYIKAVIPKIEEDAKFNAIRAELSVNLLDIKNLFNNVNEFFKDIYELQVYVDKLLRGGYVYEPRMGLYKWL